MAANGSVYLGCIAVHSCCPRNCCEITQYCVPSAILMAGPSGICRVIQTLHV